MAVNPVQVKQLQGQGTPVETGEISPTPEAWFAGGVVATMNLPVNYAGAAYRLDRACIMSRAMVRLTAGTTPLTIRMLIYQGVQGGSGSAPLIASATSGAIAAGAQTITFTFEQGSVPFSPGLVYAMLAIKSGAGSASARSCGTFAYDLDVVNVDANTHPLVFTTANAGTSGDVTPIDPLALTASSGNNAFIWRMRA